MKISIVVPCYNELDSVARMRQELLPVASKLTVNHSVELVFVDDGSIDGTWQALQDVFGDVHQPQLSLRFERHSVNQGLGAALRTGFAAASGNVIVTIDCDATYRFSEIPVLLSCLAPHVDIVTASPYHPAGGVDGVTALRLVLSRGSSGIYRVLVDPRLHTYTSLFRAYRRDVIERVSFESNGFLAGTELLVKAILMGYQATEHPTVLHARVSGASKAKLARTIFAHLGFQMRVLLHRLGLALLVEPRQAMERE